MPSDQASEPDGSAGSPLGPLGFTADEELLYRLVLRYSGRTLDQFAAMAAVPGADLHRLVTRLVAVDLVELRGETVLARPPQQAISRLVEEEDARLRTRAQELEGVRALLPALSHDHLAGCVPRGEAEQLEVIEDGDVVQLVRSLILDTAGELLWLRPDPWRMPVSSDLDEWVSARVREGRRSRAIYPTRALDVVPDVLRKRAEAGEQVRLLADVPCRLAVMGAAAALVPTEKGTPTERYFLIRQPMVLGCLMMLFDHLWEKAMAVPGLASHAFDDLGDHRVLLTQLAAGAKDEQIARALGISVRTVRRRVAALIAELGVGSRFQAGVEAVRRGWV